MLRLGGSLARRGARMGHLLSMPASAPLRSAAPLLPRAGFAALAAPEAKVDYYRVLGVKRDANAEQIKFAFREQAKQHHPDVLARKSATPSDLAVFKTINEAYAVLGDPAKRRAYDAEMFGGGAAGGVPLRVRNEGEFGGLGPVEGPKNPHEGGAAWGSGLRSSSAATTASGAASDEGAAFTAEDRQEALRKSMARAAEKQKDSARFRAALARMQRQRIEVPPQGRHWGAIAFPAAVAGIWLLNYAVFMR